MESPSSQPEVYWTKPTSHCPNSCLPVLVYRNVLPQELTAESVKSALEANKWMKGGVFKHYPQPHFHSVTHECYAALKGFTKCLYGVGPLDDEREGLRFDMKAGDIAVHPSGTAHCNIESSDDYEYMGLYPQGSPHWDNNYCKADEDETRAMAETAQKVPVPDYDPIYGLDGPLPKIWRNIATGTT